MAKKRKVGNPLALAVLSYLSQKPMHPYELSRTLRDHGDDRSIKFNHGSLYMVVQQLAKAGFVAEQETVREGQRPERTVYALTDAGRAELRDWLREMLEEPGFEYPRFVTALSLIAALPPSEVVSLLRGRLYHLAVAQEETTKLIDGVLAQGVPELFVIEEQYRLAQLRTEARFTEEFLKRVQDPDTEWTAAWASFHGESAPVDDADEEEQP
ncbi:PadR family transcriptional regulator [Streptomyces sp. NPDC051940]|uniref:PadR family transcriptional regulator n=1 Tax=Streptomyces sp. NPDC051940 TaxID=3155675 RepID=UPI0034235B14